MNKADLEVQTTILLTINRSEHFHIEDIGDVVRLLSRKKIKMENKKWSHCAHMWYVYSYIQILRMSQTETEAVYSSLLVSQNETLFVFHVYFSEFNFRTIFINKCRDLFTVYSYDRAVDALHSHFDFPLYFIGNHLSIFITNWKISSSL